ncbi:N-6 DNA methylase [Rhodoferax ferrireducens T118]|uniref:site-specific DNA-methyltransferase (adenine-specific) n=1 Tax=Albidiferax ferrireducens (strain ATCC BAA-621 / DSM 15236 / T118) TaxID=338969 RepID=Q21YQ4_ALBFT|nr:N-6 DNA methylase [Rhodoferax ferrireducens]ABD69099.1 N-6 DNA methylase [Rhodoferax ferrireducens T118]
MTQKIGAGLLEYAGKIWDTADTLRGAGIKESEWPTYMMPFFALMMLESRLRRFKQERIAEYEEETGAAFDPEDATHAKWLDDTAKAVGKGYHKDLLLHDKGLRETCLVPGGNFLNRLLSHLNSYDPDTKKLLGIDYAQGSAKFLDMQGKASDLNARDNNPLYPFAQKWASIDLTPFDNSEITTIEEHIKRKWADISAETAGEQYTPSDVIDLATAIIIELRREGKGGTGIADVYDMACGGGNFLFATEDALRDAFPKLSVRTRGQELNDPLFALASIEARFREDAQIEWGNTLTNDLFLLDKFDAIVANPPYGVDWKDFKQSLGMDASGRFAKDRMPPTSDGQLLFLQHAAFHLSEVGVAAIVHSGSTLFSGDAGGGESETRRWLIQQQDIVEAIIQLPKNEFFNTGISTYLWILNRAKPQARKGKVLLINAEDQFVKLKKNLNKKNCKIDEANCAAIVKAFRACKDGPISKVLTVDQLLYNKVEIILHRHDAEGRAIQEETALNGEVITVTIGGQSHIIKNGPLIKPDHLTTKEAAAAFNEAIKAAETLTVQSGKLTYTRDNETGAIRLDDGTTLSELGLGVLAVKAKVAKARGAEVLKVEVTLGPLKEKDTETTAFSFDPAGNDAIIRDFLATWVKEPFERVPDAVTVGCEINFNKQFPKKSEVGTVKDLLEKLHRLNAKGAEQEADFTASISGA